MKPDEVGRAEHERVRAVRVEPDPPADFAAFWGEVAAELDATPLDLELRTDGEWRATSLGGIRIGGTYRLPAGRPARPRPQWVTSHGYGSMAGTLPFELPGGPDWITVTVDVRGHGRSREGCDPGVPGWAVCGIDDPRTYIVRGAVADWLRAVQVARSLDGADPGASLLAGASLAGGLACLAAPWLEGLLGVVLQVPTFGAYDLRRRLVKAGSGAEVNACMNRLPAEGQSRIRQNLRYFDAVNAAPSIRVPALVGLGVLDDLVPGETVAAIFHALGSPQKELLSFPCSHSDHPLSARWEEFTARSYAWARALAERG